MATKKKSGNLVDLLGIAFLEVKKKFCGKKIEMKIREKYAYSHGNDIRDSLIRNQGSFMTGLRDDGAVTFEGHNLVGVLNDKYPSFFSFIEEDITDKLLPLDVEEVLNLNLYPKEIFSTDYIRQKYAGGASKVYDFSRIFTNLQLAFYVDKTKVGSLTIETTRRGGRGENFELAFDDYENKHVGSSIVPKTIRLLIQKNMKAVDRTEEMFFAQTMQELNKRYIVSYYYGSDQNKYRHTALIDNEIKALLKKHKFRHNRERNDRLVETFDKLLGMINGDIPKDEFVSLVTEYKELIDEYDYIKKVCTNQKENINVALVNFVNDKYSIVTYKNGSYIREYYGSPEDFPEEIGNKYSILANADGADITYVGFVVNDCYIVSLG